MKDESVHTLDDLLLTHDEQFVRLCYQLILGRPADPRGMHAHLSQLRQGASKNVLIASFAASSEAKGKVGKLDGLSEFMENYQRRPFKRLRKALGRLLSDDGTSINADIRALRNDLNRQSEQFALQAENTDSKLRELSEINKSLLARLIHLSEERGSSSIEDGGRMVLSSGKESRLVFNLSTSYHWRSRAVGIVRVERQLAQGLLAYADVTFVIWARTSKSFQKLSTSEAKEILSARWCDPSQQVADFAWLRADLQLKQTDTFLSMGLDWDHCPLHEMATTLRESKCKVSMACYDIVPILFPEFSVADDFEQRFKRHFVDMAHLANQVFTISKNSGRDLAAFWRSAQIEAELPLISHLPLANLEASQRLPALNDFDFDRMRHLRASRPFVLYVSSIEIRKNHRLLINVWKDLYRERGARCPVLVLVGMRGWGTADLLDQVQRMAATHAGKIIVLNEVNDELLKHLYKYCTFTVFPSFYEGWGLAATEAMAFGKACIVSDTGALAEATQGLMPKYHPLDQPGWKREITRLLDDVGYRKLLEQRVINSFKLRTWQEVSDDFVSSLSQQGLESEHTGPQP